MHKQDLKSIPLVKKRRMYSLLEDFDPHPMQYQGTAKDHMLTLLDKIHGKSLCLSLLFDKSCQNSNTIRSPADTSMPSIESLKQTVEAFKSSLKVSEEAIHKIENETREQRACMRFDTITELLPYLEQFWNGNQTPLLIAWC